MARPSIEIDKVKLATLMRLKPSLEDTATFFDCTPRTIERFIKKNYGLSFVDFRHQKMATVRLSLMKKAIEKAEKGDNTMLIFCLKVLCGWNERENDDQPRTPLNYSRPESMKK